MLFNALVANQQLSWERFYATANPQRPEFRPHSEPPVGSPGGKSTGRNERTSIALALSPSTSSATPDVAICIEPPSRAPTQRATVILGFAADDLVPDPIALARLNVGLAEVESSDSQNVLLLAGGIKSTNHVPVPEARLLLNHVPPYVTNILLDEASTITAENAIAARFLLDGLGSITQVTIATSWWHSLRARIFFRYAFHRSPYRLSFVHSGFSLHELPTAIKEFRWLFHIRRNLKQAHAMRKRLSLLATI